MTDQLTPVFEVPLTVAEKRWEAVGATLALLGEIDTETEVVAGVRVRMAVPAFVLSARLAARIASEVVAGAVVGA